MIPLFIRLVNTERYFVRAVEIWPVKPKTIKLLMVFDLTHAILYQPLQVEIHLYFHTFKQTKVLDLYIL